jgi:hypothetical protein
MFEIIAAIKSKYDATPAMKMAGGLTLNHEPAVLTMPYGVYFVESDEPEENTGSGYAETVRVTVEIYAKKAIDLMPAAKAFKDALYQQALTLSSGKVIAARKTHEEINDLETDDSTQPQVFFQMILEYMQTQVRP